MKKKRNKVLLTSTPFLIIKRNHRRTLVTDISKGTEVKRDGGLYEKQKLICGDWYWNASVKQSLQQTTFSRQWILQEAYNYAWRTLQNVQKGVCMFVLWELFNCRCDKETEFRPSLICIVISRSTKLERTKKSKRTY